jgi:hypothetical protein
MGKGNIIIVIFSIILISSLGSTIFSTSSYTQVTVLDLNAPSVISEGAAVCVQVLLKNNNNEKRSFYIGASILVIGEMEWMKLPGWGYTTEIAPFNTSMYFFKPITIQNISDVKFYDIKVSIWSDSSKNDLLFEGWYPARTNYWWS